MSSRLATRIGLLAAEERAADARDVVRVHEPTVGALARTKGSLFALAQVGGAPDTPNTDLGRAAVEALETLERDYYYDETGGILGALAKALANANRRVYHGRAQLGIPNRSSLSVVAAVVRGREAHVAKLGPASAVIVRDGRMFELPPPPAVDEEDPRVRRRRVAATLGEALEIEPYTWRGELAAGDRLSLVSRNVAQTIGVDDLKRALASLRPAQAVEHLQHLFAVRGGRGSDGLLAIEIVELPPTATTHRLEPIRPSEPLAGLPDQSPVPLADAIGRSLHGLAGRTAAVRAAGGRAVPHVMSLVLAFVPRRRPAYPRAIRRTALRQEGHRRRFGFAGMAIVAALLAVGITVGSLPTARPTEAIPRAVAARAATAEASERLAQVAERVEGIDLLDRDLAAARALLGEAFVALGRAAEAGVPEAALADLRDRVDRGLDRIHSVARLGQATTVVDLGQALGDVEPERMVAASDGSLWVLEAGRGRVVRVEPADGSAAVPYRAGQTSPEGRTLGDPWLIATAATDVVVVDRQRQTWRIDLDERIPRRMELAGVGSVDPETQLLAAVQHRPPLEIFTLYLVDADGEVQKWTPPPFIPVEFPDPPERFLADSPDLDPGAARDLRVDASMWLLHADTATRVDFGSPRSQAEYLLDPPPDADIRPMLDYRLIDGATVGDRDLLYVYDAANARILAFQRVDGAFIRQWLAPRSGPAAGTLDRVVGMAVSSAAEGPPAAYLLSPQRVVRVVLE